MAILPTLAAHPFNVGNRATPTHSEADNRLEDRSKERSEERSKERSEERNREGEIANI